MKLKYPLGIYVDDNTRENYFKRSGKMVFQFTKLEKLNAQEILELVG